MLYWISAHGKIADIPILFMTARGDIASKQRGFRIGADNYMVKPIDLNELILRIGALLRRAKIASERSSWMNSGKQIRKLHHGQWMYI